jgi:hypothetical protein
MRRPISAFQHVSISAFDFVIGLSRRSPAKADQLLLCDFCFLLS